MSDPLMSLFHPRRNAHKRDVDRALIDDGAAIRAGDVFVLDESTGESRRVLPGEWIPPDIRAAADAIAQREAKS